MYNIIIINSSNNKIFNIKNFKKKKKSKKNTSSAKLRKLFFFVWYTFLYTNAFITCLSRFEFAMRKVKYALFKSAINTT